MEYVEPDGAIGPFTGNFLTPDERHPRPITADTVRAYDASQPPLPGVPEQARLEAAERALRLLNKTYNNRRVILKNALVEFQRATGNKAIMAKDEVWLPDGRRITHTEFISHLQPLITEFSHERAE